MDSAKELANAIRETLGTSAAYTDTITGAVYAGLSEVAKSNLAVAQALNNIAKAITQTAQVTR